MNRTQFSRGFAKLYQRCNYRKRYRPSNDKKRNIPFTTERPLSNSKPRKSIIKLNALPESPHHFWTNVNDVTKFTIGRVKLIITQRSTLDSKDAERVFSLFKTNLSEILGTFQQNHIPVIVSDVSSNLLFPPFASYSLGEKDIENNIPDLFSTGNYEEILSTLFRLRAHDTTNAFCNYWIGKSLLATGRIDSAKQFLLQARDNDLLKFRAPQRINEIIRSVCKNLNVDCVSADSILARNHFAHIPGDSVFWEHLHPRINGYYEIANLFVKEIAASNFACISADKPYNTLNLLPLSQDILSICWQDTYADLSIQHLTGKWPFTNYKREPVVLSTANVYC